MFYAHSGTPGDLSDWQPLREHLAQVARLAGDRAQVFNAGDWAHLIGLLHDLGKYSAEFQARLNGSNQRADHATAGAKVVTEHMVGLFGDRKDVRAMAKIFAFGIAGHHAGLANGTGTGQERSTLEQRLSLEHGKDLPVLDETWKEELFLPLDLGIPRIKAHANPKKYKNFRWAFFTRMLFSCLIDADRIDTENYARRVSGQKPLESDYPAIALLQHRLKLHLAHLEQSAKVTPVNTLRQGVLKHALHQSALPKGLFSLTVPTGGGKTLTSLAFALEHAVKNQLRRVIYVIPFTSIIEQTAEVFRRSLGEYEGAVLEHHSAFDRDKLPELIEKLAPRPKADYRDKLRLAMESWDAPVVVTTAVQFFESLFSDRPSQCRKLHNIANSIIVLDEAQTLPLKLLRPTMAAIEELALNYDCSIVLCTATQPALSHEDFHNGFPGVREIAPDPKALFEQLQRTQIETLGEQVDDQLVAHLRTNKQVLMIVNSRRHARSLFDAIESEDGAFHLTTAMCAAHRSERLREIRGRLLNNLPCRLVATSLIEAGVDVDFPVVYRAEAGLDSIAQAAGRCNREGRRAPEDSKVFIFQSPEWSAPPELEQLAAPMRSILRKHQGDVLGPAAIKDYFNQVYYSKGKELDHHKILTSHADTEECDFAFQDIAKAFRMIESHMLPVIVPFGDKAKNFLSELRELPDHASVSGLAQKLQRYVVQIPETAFAGVLKLGAIAPIQPDRFGGQFYELVAESLYSSSVGFNFSDPTAIAAETTVF
jgi:CRISPR-associated endonuclease/helicase Cas3